MANDLAGKVAIVTGAAMGLGRAVALRLAQDGSDIVLVDVDMKLMEEVAAEIRALGRKTLIHAVDISQWTQVKEMADNVIATFRRIDILVNSAGILGPTLPVWEYGVDDWDRVVAIDLKGTFLMCKAVIEQMRRQRSGRIVNFASIAGKDGNPNSCAYTASKAGVIAFTRGLALEVAQENIFVNSIAPTMIEGKMSASMTDEQRNMLFSKIPMRRFGKPDEVAALVKFLVSEECSFSTGACYDISGGRAVY
jgi:3-oxoacyl-[acyl-carrier protein] reductase